MIKELNIFGDITSEAWYDEDVTPSNVKKEIESLTASDELKVNINCYGGEVFAAVAISNMISNCPAKKTFNILGICASAATMLFTDSDIVNISKGAMMMYHKPLVCCRGNANDFRKQIDILDKIENENIIKPLSVRTKKPIDELTKLITDEWWLTSDEAILNLGFIGTGSEAIENSAKTKQTDIYKNFIEKKKALNVDAFKQFTNFKKTIKKMKEILLNLLALTMTALTQGGMEIPAELQAEIDALTAAINALSDNPDEGADQTTTNELLQKLTDIAEKIKDNGQKATVNNKITESKVAALNVAIKNFETKQRNLGGGQPKAKNLNFDAMAKNNGRLKVVNANNANFAKSTEEEFSFSQVLRNSGFLAGLKEMVQAEGTNQIMWTEGTRGENVAAIVAIGNDKPFKTNTTAVVTKALDTLAQGVTVPVQLLKAINGVQSLYEDDLKGDIEDKIALQVAAVLATANNPIVTTATVNTGTATIADVIEVAYWQLRPYAQGKTIHIAISSEKQKELNLLKDKNENKVAKISYPDLAIENFIADGTYTSDKIFGWVDQLSVRFYNDGLWVGSDELNGRGVSGDNFKKNQISILAEYLNEGIVIRGTDVVTTIYDSIQGVIGDLTPQP